MTAFHCTACHRRLTPDLTEVPMPPYVTEDAPNPESPYFPPLMPRGTYALSPHTGDYVLHPEDVSGTALHPNRARLNGCCRLDGLDGPNLVCAGCGAELATQQSDCWSQQLIALIPAAVTAG